MGVGGSEQARISSLQVTAFLQPVMCIQMSCQRVSTLCHSTGGNALLLGPVPGTMPGSSPDPHSDTQDTCVWKAKVCHCTHLAYVGQGCDQSLAHLSHNGRMSPI